MEDSAIIAPSGPGCNPTSFVYELARPYYSDTGHPSVDPVVLFKMLLIGHLYGITSERRLMDEIRVNLAYRWLLGYDLDEAIPDHRVLSKARARFPLAVFEAFFDRTVELCKTAGLVHGETAAAMNMKKLVKSKETARDDGSSGPQPDNDRSPIQLAV